MKHMTKWRGAGVVVTVVLAIGVPGLAQGERYDLTSDDGVLVPMRDGVGLATDVIRPDAEGRFPVVMSRTPYGRQEMRMLAGALAPMGYAFVLQDVRGRFDSEGEWDPFGNEAEDGHDAVEWAAAQEWSTGRVVLIGGSYAAGTAWLAARDGSEHVAGLVPFVSPGDIYSLCWIDGAFNHGALLMWSSLMTPPRFTMAEFGSFQNHAWDEIFASLPVVDALGHLGQDPAFFRDWVAHPTHDAYWARSSWRDRAPDVPVLHIAGWYDVFQRDTIGNYVTMREAGREGQQLLVGPWHHQNIGSRTTGEVDFGDAASMNFIGEAVVPFLAHCFEGAPLPPEPVRVFTMGENAWNDYQDWPVPGAREVSFALGSSGGANSSAGDGWLSVESRAGGEGSDAFTYDPSDPVPTRGGGTCCWPKVMPWGAMDQSSVALREDVLVFSTGVLEEDLRVTGPVEVVLFADSSAPSTDFTAKLVDVSPEGYAMNLTDGIVRTEMDGEREIRIDLGYTSNLFKAGHRIRLEISSSNFPRFSRNLNTGEQPEIGTETAIAQQTIFHDEGRPSRLVLHVLD